MTTAGQNSTKALQEVVDYARTFPELTPTLGVGGLSDQPARWIANRVMNALLGGGYVQLPGRAEPTRVGPFPWKWNRIIPPWFLTNSWQQDYASYGFNTLKWLQDALIIDINNTQQPKPFFGLEVKRDLPMASTQFGRPGQVCWLQNNQLQYGTWGGGNSQIVGPVNPGPGFTYINPIGAASSPANAALQIIDANGNYLLMTSFNGITGTPVSVTCGSTAPAAPANSLPGVTVTDGTATWTVLDPYGQGFRLVPRPPQTGVVYQVNLVGQARPVEFTALSQLLNPVPDDFAMYFFEGFTTFCYENSPEQKVAGKFAMRFKLWMDQLQEAIGTGDREPNQGGFYPDKNVMDGYPTGPVGPAWPFGAPYGSS